MPTSTPPASRSGRAAASAPASGEPIPPRGSENAAPPPPSPRVPPRGDTSASQAAALSGAPQRPQTPDLELAGYLLARQITGRPVPAPTVALLQRANESKKEVLQLMQYGRANVSTDLQATNNEGFHRLLAQRHVIGSTSSLGQAPAHTFAHDAALAARAGSGNCGEFAFVAAHVHAGRLQAGESLTVEKAPDFDHSWVAVKGRASPGGTVPRVVIDVWGDGPVIDVNDGTFTAPANDTPLVEHTIHHADAATANQRFESLRVNLGERTERRLDLMISANKRDERKPTGTVYEPMPIVDSTFCADARHALQNEADQAQFRQAAATLGRETTALANGPDEAAVERIIDFAANLDVPHDRHLAAPPAKRQRTTPDEDL